MLAAVVAAIAPGGGTVDRTVSCPVPVQGGVNVLQVTAYVRGRVDNGAAIVPQPAGAGVFGVRARITLGPNGLPARALFAGVTGAKRRPVFLIDWMPAKIVAWTAGDCFDR